MKNLERAIKTTREAGAAYWLKKVGQRMFCDKCLTVRQELLAPNCRQNKNPRRNRSDISHFDLSQATSSNIRKWRAVRFKHPIIAYLKSVQVICIPQALNI